MKKILELKKTGHGWLKSIRTNNGRHSVFELKVDDIRVIFQSVEGKLVIIDADYRQNAFMGNKRKKLKRL